MIHRMPINWKEDESLNLLFLFYQESNELLFKNTFDSYELPMHNSITIIDEIQSIYELMKATGTLELYFEKYTTPMIEEFMDFAKNDKILKELLGNANEIINKFSSVKKDYVLLVNLINIVQRRCKIENYIEKCKFEIENIICNNIKEDKDNLIIYIKNLYISLVNFGYSKEYIFREIENFFKIETIEDASQIKDFLKIFSCNKKNYEFVVFIGTSVLEYMPQEFGKTFGEKNLVKIDRSLEPETPEMNKIWKEFDYCNGKKINKHINIGVYNFSKDHIDPYKCIENFIFNVSYHQKMIRYFNHKFKSKPVGGVFLKNNNGSYERIYINSQVNTQKLPSKEFIAARVRNFLSSKNLGASAHFSIFHAFDLHAEAINSKSMSVRLKVFWTAMEVIFSLKNAKIDKSGVIDSMLIIIQKTYILKIFSILHIQLKKYINYVNNETLNSIDISSLKKFIEFFIHFDIGNDDMMDVFKEISKSPLLLYRINTLKLLLKDGQAISSLLKFNEKKIRWQIKRINRGRNISTHVGMDMDEIDTAVKHIHRYFDYIIDFILCCIENGRYVNSIPEMVVEMAIDNSAHAEFLEKNKNESLTIDNYQKFLFGFDEQLINYNFINYNN